jgi:O-antigen/teichoic acid export membrane protein
VTWPPTSSSSGLGLAVRELAGSSVVYGLGSILTRALIFLLLPVYTRFLSPADYGIVTVTATITSILLLVYPLGIHGAASRFYFAVDSPEERRSRTGTLWLATVLFAGLAAVLLDLAGGSLLQRVVPGLPFHPYVRLAIWTAFLLALSLVPFLVLQLQQRPGTYLAVTVGSSLATAAATLLFVVGLKEGAAGYLRGALAGAAVTALCAIGIAARSVRMTIRRDVALAALGYGLPLVPHALAGWVLELSDRTILARYATLGDVGIYSLGYQIGTVPGLIIAAFNAAWIPYLFKALGTGEPHAPERLSRLATYYAMTLVFFALGLALLVGPMLRLLVAPAYHASAGITPWITAAYVLYGLYIIPISFLFWRERTGRVPLVTLMAGVVNVGLNLWLIPRYGMIAAAWSTLGAYLVMLPVAWASARGVHPFPYEYGRLARVLLVGGALFAVGSALPYASPSLEMAGRLAAWAAFPFALAAVGTFQSRELRAAWMVCRWRRAEHAGG